MKMDEKYNLICISWTVKYWNKHSLVFTGSGVGRAQAFLTDTGFGWVKTQDNV